MNLADYPLYGQQPAAQAPWEADPVVQPAGAGGAPWEADPVVEPEPPADPQPSRWNAAAEGVANDIGAGLQGVNPVAMGEKRGQAVGVLRPLYPGSDRMVVDVDGTIEPVENYPSDRYATRVEGGSTYIYPKTEDVKEGRLASLGRLLGYGAAEQFGQIAKAAGPSPKQVAAQAAEDLGVTPSFAMRGTVQGKVAAAGEQFAPTAGAFRRDAERVTEEMAGAAGKLADRAGPGITPYEAGAALQDGGEAYVRGVREFQGRLYGEVDKAIPRQTPMQAPATAALLERETGAMAGLPNIAGTLGNRTIDGWLADLKSGNLTWEAARKLRTDVGEALRSSSGPATDQTKGRLKAVYAALSEDLDAAAKSAGPEAAHAWTRANRYKRASEERIESAFGKILKADTPERAYSILTGMAAEGAGGANIDGLRRVFGSLPADERAVVAGTVIRRLGRATAGAQDAAGEAFSADTFLTNWNRMSPEARGIIARGGLDDGVEVGLTKLAGIIEKAKESGTFRNRSNTGNAISAGAFGAWAFTSPAQAIAAGALSHLTARAVTSPAFLHALNRAAATGKTDALMKIAKGKDPLALEAATILRLQAAEVSPPPQPSTYGPATYSGAP